MDKVSTVSNNGETKGNVPCVLGNLLVFSLAEGACLNCLKSLFAYVLVSPVAAGDLKSAVGGEIIVPRISGVLFPALGVEGLGIVEPSSLVSLGCKRPSIASSDSCIWRSEGSSIGLGAKTSSSSMVIAELISSIAAEASGLRLAITPQRLLNSSALRP